MEKEANRREEIIDASGELFFTKGYSDTSIQNIIDKTNIAKGTLYHYFKSKDDILDSLTKKYIASYYSKVIKKLDSNLNAIEKFNFFFSYTQNWKLKNLKLMRVMLSVFMSEKNLPLRNRLIVNSLETVFPIYKQIIDQGIREGLFKVFNSELTAEFLLGSLNIHGEMMTKILLDESLGEEAMKKLKDQVHFIEDSMERILGAEKGVLKIVPEEQLEKLLGMLQEEI